MTPSAQAAGERRGGRQARWTREAIITKIREWVELYGEPPRAADWNPSAARWSGAEWRIERYRAGDWPSLNAAKGAFDGSFNAAIIAAGYTPNRPGPPSRKVAEARADFDRVEMHPIARAALDAAQARVRDLEATLATRERMLDVARERARTHAEEANRARAAARSLRETRTAPPVERRTRTVTRTRTVRVADEAALDRLRKRLGRAQGQAADAEALARAERDQRKSTERELRAAERARDGARAKLADARDDIRRLEREAAGMHDEITALRAELARAGDRPAEPVRVEVRERIVQHATDRDVADAQAAQARAEREAHDAEIRAARAERELRETVALVTGEQRRLTPTEVEQLKARGPAGPAVVAKALEALARGRRSGNPTALRAALGELASAAITWRERMP